MSDTTSVKEKISAGTIARTIVLALALINQILSLNGIQVIPISDEDINAIVSTLWTVIASVIAWWENNSFTQKAIQADKVVNGQADIVEKNE